MMGAAGIVETVSAALSLKTGLLPPTANSEQPDPEIIMNLAARTTEVNCRFALKNSYGIGGANASIVLEKLQ
jgi:3-oxoacyl-[acyl-carrier-protein] synthase II